MEVEREGGVEVEREGGRGGGREGSMGGGRESGTQRNERSDELLKTTGTALHLY